MNGLKTYISLFSSSGVGCYGFLQDGYECVATNELLERRIKVQKANNKCKYETGYVNGDITNNETRNAIFTEIDRWKKNEGLLEIDVVVATPPCQGMSVANHKKGVDEIKRNSLVVESLSIINDIEPKVFILENVSAFLKTSCTDSDGIDKPISQAIENNLSEKYSIRAEVLNFKNYGSLSSRTRTLVIGVRRDCLNLFSAIDLFPDYQSEVTLRQVIGNLPRLTEFNQFSSDDIYHSFRKYAEHMRIWISNTPEGASAFDNINPKHIPHQIINGEIVFNKRKNAGKYTRQLWDKCAPCIHTRNDQLASQNTVHPEDDRVFSIRELMMLMTIPNSFKWTSVSLEKLNQLSTDGRVAYLKKDEINIRQSIGEAVPTAIFHSIAKKISKSLFEDTISDADLKKIVNENNLTKYENIIEFIKLNSNDYTFSQLQRIVELSNINMKEMSAHYTDKVLVSEIMAKLPKIQKKKIRILEPSVGSGNFLSGTIKYYNYAEKLVIDVVDIDERAINILKILVNSIKLPDNVEINFHVGDFLLFTTHCRYDLVIGNPPFTKVRANKISLPIGTQIKSTNLSAYFLEYTMKIADYVILVMPKNVLNTSDYLDIRNQITDKHLESIIDFGEKGFKFASIETVCLFINCTENIKKTKKTNVISVPRKQQIIQRQDYITDVSLPYWIIYRDDFFDRFMNSLQLNVFTVFRDRQISNRFLYDRGDLRVLKSRNINDNGTIILDLDNYDVFANSSEVSKFTAYNYLNREDVYLTPNMTYKSRVMRKPKNCLVNGSIAVLELKDDIVDNLSDDDLIFFSSEEYRAFLQIARNYQTRSINIDNNSVYFFGIRRRLNDE